MTKRISKLVVGNWKMNGRLPDNAALLQAVAAGADDFPPAIRVAVCVPAVYLAQAEALLRGSPVAWGVQDVSAHAQGAFTGEIAASMAADFGAHYAIVGHSERRAYHHESPELVATKSLQVLDAGMTPIVCVGESLAQREAGLTATVVREQLQAVLDRLSGAQAARLVVAYEPVWAIGTGKSASTAQAQEVHAVLRACMRAKDDAAARALLLYGGSVKPENAGELFAQADIDGGLIGGASLVAEDFLGICRAAAASVGGVDTAQVS